MSSLSALSEYYSVKTIKGKADAGRILNHEEKVALFYTAGFLDNEHILLHRILEPCPDYRYKAVARQAKNIHPRPISYLEPGAGNAQRGCPCAGC